MIPASKAFVVECEMFLVQCAPSGPPIHPSDCRVGGKIIPQIHILKVPRLEAHIRIPVGVDVERRAALQVCYSGSERRRQCKRRIQYRRDRARSSREQVVAGISR